jgi:hypothetical protein
MWVPLHSRSHLSRLHHLVQGWVTDPVNHPHSFNFLLPLLESSTLFPLPPSLTEGYIKSPFCPHGRLAWTLFLTPSRPAKVSLVLSSLVPASTHWYCALLISLPNLSLTSDLLGVISYTRYTHTLIYQPVLYEISYSIHIPQEISSAASHLVISLLRQLPFRQPTHQTFCLHQPSALSFLHY